MMTDAPPEGDQPTSPESYDALCDLEVVVVRRCVVCGGSGEVLHEGLQDRIFAAPGVWRLRRCLDRDCGALWLDPRAAGHEIPKLYESYYTHVAPGRRGGFWNWVRAAIRATDLGYPGPKGLLASLAVIGARLIPGKRDQANAEVFHLPAEARGSVLDVGCGAGESLVKLRELGWEAQGIDFDEGAVKAASARGLDVALGDLRSANFPDDTFDAVVSSHVLEHVADPRDFITESLRILKPGGLMAHITPNPDSALHRVFGRNYLHLDPPRHLNILTPRSLDRLAREAGLRNVSLTSSFANSYAVYFTSDRIRATGRADVVQRISFQNRMKSRLLAGYISLKHCSEKFAGDEIIMMASKEKGSR